MTKSAHRSLRVHLETAGWAVSATLEVPNAPAPIEALAPFLQRLASLSAEAAADAAAREGKRISCAKGCGACCRQLVAISLVEARALARLVAEMPAPRRNEIRRRFAHALRRIEESGVLTRNIAADESAPETPLALSPAQKRAAAWFALRVACPFLEDESCSIHEARPLVCREYQVTSPSAACARLYREPVDRVDPPVRLGEALARATARIAGVAVAMVPLVMALQIPPEVDAALAEPRDMTETLKVILSEIGAWRMD